MNQQISVEPSDRRWLTRDSLPLIGGLLACGLAFGLLYLYLSNWPQYLVLDTPYPGTGAWENTQQTVQTWSDSNDKFFIWRREGRVYPACCGSTDSWETVIAYFDQWFTANGWERAERQGDTPCRVFMAESSFLPVGKNGYVVYKPPNSPVYKWVPTVCLAVWPTSANSVGEFHIILLTANPSALTTLRDAFD